MLRVSVSQDNDVEISVYSTEQSQKIENRDEFKQTAFLKQLRLILSSFFDGPLHAHVLQLLTIVYTLLVMCGQKNCLCMKVYIRR